MADKCDLDQIFRNEAAQLRMADKVPADKATWEIQRRRLREQITAAMGPVPEKPCPLNPRVLDTAKRDGYRLEKIIFQSRNQVWVTATAYVPLRPEKVPAVLVVHGHWPWARRDPVVQARCVGLVRLGFFVLAVDAFGAGERHTQPARGTYHGALYGSTLWPVGQTLLGVQVYDNQRAVDYILSRSEVNGKLGITGASGGGNQTMYAGALDERFSAVVPVCSVGNYQAYLRAACCVCEVLPGALRFTEEGDILGLVAPRALLIINASKDASQFSPKEAEKSVTHARGIFALYQAEAHLHQRTFISAHDYNQPMRELMYGWMLKYLKGDGQGLPVPEPELSIEKVEELACFPKLQDRPASFMTPPLLASSFAKELIARHNRLKPTHKQMWEASSITMRHDLVKFLGLAKAPSQQTLPVEKTKTQASAPSFHFEFNTETGIKNSGTLFSPSKNPQEANAPFNCLIITNEISAMIDAWKVALQARTYLINWLAARKQSATLILRIEDIDSPRVKAGAAALLETDLRWLGLDWDEGPYFQSARLAEYGRALADLQSRQLVYPCTCSRSDIARAASAPHLDHVEPIYPGTCAYRQANDSHFDSDQPVAWRFRSNCPPPFTDTFWGAVNVPYDQCGGDFVVWKNNRTPAYHLAVVIDDASMGISHVIRGDDLIPATPRQLMLYQALNLQSPRFAHVPLVLGPDGRRLAKRHGDTRILALREAGVRPEALIGLLAWSCGWLKQPEPIAAKELLDSFSWEQIPVQPLVLTPDLLRLIGYSS